MSESNRGQSDPKQREVYGLAEALLGNIITADETQRLNELLFNDAATRRWYVRFMYETILLRSWSPAPSERGEGENGRKSGVETNRSRPAAMSPPLPRSHAPPLVFHGLLGGALASYAIAAVILGAGIVAAWAWKLGGRQEAVAVAERTVGAGQLVFPAAPVVARVTKLVGDGWRGQLAVGAEIRAPSNLVFSQGLVEIAYNCGARVTLVGPAAFDVDSPNSGVLHVGKATVRTPRAGDGPLFCILSPTALVTERGDCEFGLMVDESRASRVYSFRGNVEYRPPERWGETKILLLKSRDWLLADRDAKGGYRVDFVKGRKLPQEFVDQWFKGFPVVSDEAEGKRSARNRSPSS